MRKEIHDYILESASIFPFYAILLACKSTGALENNLLSPSTHVDIIGYYFY